MYWGSSHRLPIVYYFKILLNSSQAICGLADISRRLIPHPPLGVLRSWEHRHFILAVRGSVCFSWWLLNFLPLKLEKMFYIWSRKIILSCAFIIIIKSLVWIKSYSVYVSLWYHHFRILDIAWWRAMGNRMREQQKEHNLNIIAHNTEFMISYIQCMQPGIYWIDHSVSQLFFNIFEKPVLAYGLCLMDL